MKVDDRYYFRGKFVDTGRWVYGGLCWMGENFLILQDKTMHKVDPATIGQCSGMKDDSGKLMYEGDRIRISGEDPYANETICVEYNWEFVGVLKLCEYIWCVEDPASRTMIPLIDIPFEEMTAEIIGNIHENEKETSE